MKAPKYHHDPVGFIDAYIRFNEKGQSWSLNRHQRRVLKKAFQWDAEGQLLFRVLLWGEMKKSGKTFLAACLILWWAFITSNTEIITAANDLEQASSRVFRTIVNLIKYNPELSQSCKIRATEIHLSNGTIITAIASDYKGAAGSRHSLVVFDELWGYTLEAAQRLFEELTPPPTESNAWILITTTAGWVGESRVLEGFYKQGLAGERIDEDLELFRANELVMFWSHTPRQPWQTESYYNQQRRILRPATYQRLHENKWVTNESTFLTPELFDSCVDAALIPLLPTKKTTLYVGVDAGIKHDSSAVVAVSREGDLVKLALHRIWKPSPRQPLNLEETVEEFLRQLEGQYNVQKILCDPYQLHRSITTLKAAGLPIEEFPQTTGNTTRMGQAIFDLFNGKNIRLYPDDEIRSQALHTVAVENPRGWRIAKERASRKIDVIVALSMAGVACLDDTRGEFGLINTVLDAETLEAFDQQQKEESRQQMLSTVSKWGYWFPGEGFLTETSPQEERRA